MQRSPASAAGLLLRAGRARGCRCERSWRFQPTVNRMPRIETRNPIASRNVAHNVGTSRVQQPGKPPAPTSPHTSVPPGLSGKLRVGNMNTDQLSKLAASADPTFRATGLERVADIRTSREGRTARKELAASMAALELLYEGAQPDSPAMHLNGGRHLPLTIPQDLARGLRQHLTSGQGVSSRFRHDDAAQTPSASGTYTAGRNVGYNLFNVPTSDGRRHVLITIGGLTSGPSVGGSAAARTGASPLRTMRQIGEIGGSVVGARTEMKKFGEALAQFVVSECAKDPHLVFEIQGHSYGSVGAAVAVQGAISQACMVKGTFVNPAPLPRPADTAAFNAGVEAIGGENVLSALLTTFIAPGDPVTGIQKSAIGSRVLKLTQQDWPIEKLSNVYDFHHPDLNGVERHDHPSRSITHGYMAQRASPLQPGAQPPTDITLLQQWTDANVFIARQHAVTTIRL